MSIYPVRLKEWFPPGDDMYEIAYSVTIGMRCYGCDKKVRYSKAYGHHSLPWGHGDLWCSERCFDKGKVAKPDYRRVRRINRKFLKSQERFVKVDL